MAGAWQFPVEYDVLNNLDKVVRQHPEAQLLVLSEYTIDGPVPERIKTWCRKNGRYLIIGAKIPDGNYYDTAFVVEPDGNPYSGGQGVPVQTFFRMVARPGNRRYGIRRGARSVCASAMI